ncbi:hypothetical protein ACJIZ3_023526 [Penstemon smallii]|uniref:Oberon PHD finger domain-containing protein n=1 Tax=Penstemon smallii TaxID=265156 RepID=A0ABD3TQC8_9LAMI
MKTLKREMAEEVPRTNNSLKRASLGLKDPNPVKKHRKGKNIVVDVPPTYGVKICENLACKATLSSEVKFCKRCSCCICKRYDDNKDPSKWMECTTDSDFDGSCGFSCHIECALIEKIKDGSYCCARCGKISSLIRCWKKQLIKAKECRSVHDFCSRIFLSYKLLNGSSKYKELHRFIEEVKDHLEEEFNCPIDEFGKDKKRIVGRLSSADKVLGLISTAIENADKMLSSNSSLVLICDAEPRNLTVTELGLSSGFKVYNTMIDLNVPPVPHLSEVPHEFDATKKNGLGDNFEKIVKTICCLEREGHINEVFRKKFLTWFTLKAGDQERRIICAFQQAMADTPTILADQLKDTFSYFIFNQSV